MIFLVFQNASDQKTEMEKIKGRMAQEVSKIEERKVQIDHELKEVQVSHVYYVSVTKKTHLLNSVSFPLLTVAAL